MYDVAYVNCQASEGTLYCPSGTGYFNLYDLLEFLIFVSEIVFCFYPAIGYLLKSAETFIRFLLHFFLSEEKIKVMR